MLKQAVNTTPMF